MIGKYLYKKSTKVGLIIIQALCVCVLVFSLLNIGFWMEDSYSLRDMSRNFEETDLFFRQVDLIVRQKIAGQQNRFLFETDGKYDEYREIDIQAFGAEAVLVHDMNTTYLLGDLIRFVENGDQKRLHDALTEAKEIRMQDGLIAGELLEEQSDVLETILPVTGISLAECSRWYSNPYDYVLKLYERLDEVSQEIYDRYQEYRNVQEESWAAEAPSNLKYCIEDTTSGILYTNSDGSDYEEAVQAVQADFSFSTLYEGERSFNLMISGSDETMNEAAAEWFMRERFVGANEKVFLAVNPAYPVNDVLHSYFVIFSRRGSIVWGYIILSLLSFIILGLSFVLSVFSAGWLEGYPTPGTVRLDRVPTELTAGIYMTIGVLYLILLSGRLSSPWNLGRKELLFISLICSSAWMVFLSGFLSLVRRYRTKTLWSNSISLLLIQTWKQVTASRAASGQLLIFFIIFVVLNFLFSLLGNLGLFLTIVMDMAILLYLLQDMAGKRRIYEGIHQISKGDLKYRINVSGLPGENYEMAKAVNEMGDGLQEAVDAIVKNERLKAELITNVSHDIKTPLTSIVNYVDLLKRENLEGERVQRYIEVLEQKSQRLKQLTEDLVEASKISSGNVELNMMKIQIQSMVQQAYGEFQERLEEMGLSVVFEMEKDPICIMADGRHLWRVLENLLGNICKYARRDTQVWFRLYREEDQVVLVLENISRDPIHVEAGELTGRFVRGDQSRSTEGSGLGLSIAQNLTRLQGGTFALEVKEEKFLAIIKFPEVI